MSSVGDVHNPVFGLSSLSAEQRNAFMQHQLIYTSLIDTAILLYFATMGNSNLSLDLKGSIPG
jgi:hypothetical protein